MADKTTPPGDSWPSASVDDTNHSNNESTAPSPTVLVASPMPGKVLLLTGAPESRRLNWADAGLLTTFQAPVAQFALLQPPPRSSSSSLPSPPPRLVVDVPKAEEKEDHHDAANQDKSALDLAVWRALPLRRTHIPTGFSQQHDLLFFGRFPSSADFMTTADFSLRRRAASPSSLGDDLTPLEEEDDGDDESEETASQRLAEFYEHSLAVHDDLASSQLLPQHGSQGDDDGSMDETTTTTSIDADDDYDDSTSLLTKDGNNTAMLPPKTPLRPAWGRRLANADPRLTDLHDIPSAKVLTSLVPQTVTVNLVVCIISIAAPRVVATRYGCTSTLVEVLVGDETKSGFSVTFWLPGGNTNDNDSAGYGALAGLRSQDIVLMQNVALNVFRNKVYGGSLRRDMTRVHLLFRGRLVDDEDVGGYYSRADLARRRSSRRTTITASATTTARDGQPPPPNSQLDKTKRVREWVLDFVGGGSPVVVVPAAADAGSKGTKRKRNGKERVPPPRDWEQPPPLDSPSRLG